MVLEEKPVAGGGEEEESGDEAIDMEVISHFSFSEGFPFPIWPYF